MLFFPEKFAFHRCNKMEQNYVMFSEMDYYKTLWAWIYSQSAPSRFHIGLSLGPEALGVLRHCAVDLS